MRKKTKTCPAGDMIFRWIARAHEAEEKLGKTFKLLKKADDVRAYSWPKLHEEILELLKSENKK